MPPRRSRQPPNAARRGPPRAASVVPQARLREVARQALHAHEDMSIAPLARLPELLGEFGVDAADLLARNGIEPGRLHDPTARVAFERVGRLLVDCVDATDCPHFGLLLGQRAGMTAPGVPAALLYHADSVGQGLRSLALHLHVHDRGAVLSLTPVERDQVRLTYLIFHPGTTGAVHMLDAVLGVMAAVMKALCGPGWRPTEVLLPRSRPAQVAPYRACFQAPLRFDSPYAGLVFPATDLARRLPGARPDERGRVERQIADLERSSTYTTSERVLRELARTVMAEAPSGPRVAAALGLSRRSLHERLAAEGTRYSTLLAEVRCEIARQLLEGTRMPVGDIALTLHYGSPGAFSRAYKAWTGVSPRTVRSRRAAAAITAGDGYTATSPPESTQ